MRGRIFLAGAFGAIGVRVTPQLVVDGWRVVGMTRSRERAAAMNGFGIETVIANAFDADAVLQAVRSFAPNVLMHQLTDLPRELSKLDDEALRRNARIREHGTRNLVRAAEQADVTRLVVQSIAFDYAREALRPHEESQELAGRKLPATATSLGVVSLEDQVSASAIPWVILRYGRLYGPGTGSDRPWGAAPLHVDAAARAAALAARSEATGVFNIAESDGDVDSSRARRLLDWDPDWRLE